jgi:glycosyltransferase involved in cell wall biosynthesis
MTGQPKVTVVTPVYNGAGFLGEAIESVLAQTYSNWEYIIADNCSTDETFAVARRFAARDRRIRVVRTAPHLPLMQNWNRALSLLSADTVYTKELHADDILMPNCLAEMVALLEEYPTAAFASSYILYGTIVAHLGVPLGARLLRGQDVIRRTLLGDWYLFGSPSSIMVRTKFARQIGQAFYDERLRHADVDACYRLLEHHDFGFIHQILSATRTHPASITNNFTVSYSTVALEHFCFLIHYGPKYFDDATFQREYRVALRRYRRQFARRLVGGGGAPYWRFHRQHLAQFGYRLGPIDAAMGALAEIALSIVDTRHAARSIRKMTRLIFGDGKPSLERPPNRGRPLDTDMIATTMTSRPPLDNATPGEVK